MTSTRESGFSRRALLGGAGAGLAVGATGGALARAAAVPGAPSGPPALGAAEVDHQGPHQAGILQPQQARAQLAAFDLAPDAGLGGLRALLQQWSRTIARLTSGEPATSHENQIALDAGPSSLTVTVGFGATLFDKAGLADRRPPALTPLPDFPLDAIDRARSDGDLWVQIGADDALVAFHALRVLQQQAAPAASVRWQMAGFARTPGATARPMTGRNLMGQVDGTNNPEPTDPDFAARIFATGPDWMAGGSYAVLRRIRMLLDDWENLPTDRQERFIGRRKSDGSPLSGGTESTPVDLAKQNPDGTLAIPADAHVRVAAPAANGGAAMLRRGFSYADGVLADGSPDAGLLFVAFQADPARGFVPVQQKLARGDGLSRFLRHEASGLYAVPPGVRDGAGYLGQALLEG
ncbi:iron uptake transporter deferrochelatase/peroxidase subunit [Kitasatospora sp. NBC_01287]|uniref:iron uptake transporter deferrochelatase/peroxidase subunit n=1 Tax=Kitasatospora sp. NBC_01287 TaxID=2903573 RepID=UPI002255A438|nr:iron uptake transporter deferrochelatase/peroxidase subunit [Kitasatospora sp. NBC_01287]MCX4747879.1 iron uptake transporter deferrochelatase/peroxidase subunit [Kitasatospora sp. NBC_01287]